MKLNKEGQLTKYNMGEHLSAEQSYYPETDLLHYTTVKQDNSIVRQDYEYGWDENTGNLEWREKYLSSDRSTWVKEQFGYDDLNRLETVNRSNNANTTPVTTLTMVYTPDGTGNIHTKTGIGEYAYDPNRVHAVTSVENTGGIISTVPQGIEYTAFNKTKHIGEIPYTLDITYNTSDERIIQVINNNGSLYQSKVYVGGMYEKITDASGTREVYYLSGPNGWFATYTIYADGHSETNYILKDHLGSVNYVLNEDGTVKQELSFDAWGNRRNPSTWLPFTGTPPAAVTDRGFTGHEHLYVFGLINMNGRVYDPILGRMLSPDNYVQAPDNTQNMNRYSYCVNNPLVYTDPSGNWAGWDDLIVGGVGFAFGYLSHGFTTGEWGWSAVGAGALSAGAFMLGYYTAGAGTASYGSIASGFSAAGAQGCANTVGLSFAGQMVVTSTISSFMPSMTVPIENNFSVSMSPALAFSPCGFSAGVNMSATYTTGDWALSGGYGVNNTGHRLSGGTSYYDRTNNQYWSGALSHYGGGNDNQFMWQAGWNKESAHIALNEDYGFSDKYRTFALEGGTNNISIGTMLYTTPHGNEYGEKYNTSHIWKKERQYQEGERIYSALYLSFRNDNSISRVGIDAPWVNDFFQGGFHSSFGIFPQNTNLFDCKYGPGSTRPYYYRGIYNPYSLY